MKKWLSLVLSIGLLLAFISSVPAALAEDDAFVTLNWYTKGDKPSDYDMVFEKVNEYLGEKINAKVNMNFLQWGDEWDTFMATQAATNEGDVDIIFTAVWDQMRTYIDQGYLIPLNGDDDYGDLLEEYGQDIETHINPVFISGNLIDGKLYGISCNKELSASVGYLFNPDLVEKYGFDLSTVKKPEDIEPMLEVIKENEPDLIAPIGLGNGGLSFFPPFVGVGADISMTVQHRDNSSTEIFNLFATDEWRELFDITRRWYQAGYINSDVINLSPTFEADFQAGQYFVIPQSMHPGWGGEMTVNGRASLEVILYSPIIRTDDVGGSLLSIVEGSDNPERAMQFINLLESDSYLINLVVFGLEGVHYDFVDEENGIVQITDRGEEQYNLRGDAWMFGNQLMNYLTTEEDPNKWEIIEEYNNEGTPVLSLGFFYEVKPELLPLIATLSDIRREYEPLLQGQLDVDEKLPEFLAALEAAGIQQAIDDAQEQFDAWYADQEQ